MSRAYAKFECPYCGKTISMAGVARYNHYKMHERQGLLVASRQLYPNGRHARYSFVATKKGIEAKRRQRLLHKRIADEVN